MLFIYFFYFAAIVCWSFELRLCFLYGTLCRFYLAREERAGDRERERERENERKGELVTFLLSSRYHVAVIAHKHFFTVV